MLPVPPKHGAIEPAAGLVFRLLKCDRCASVWPTERDEAHGGSRRDGEPCAYRWGDGRVCRGHVHPLGYEPPRPSWTEEPYEAPRARPAGAWGEGDDQWRKVLGVALDCRDLGTVRKAYRALVLKLHPDAGGSHKAMVDANKAYADALAELGQP